MQKSELIKAISERTGVSQKQAKEIVESSLEVIAEALARGEKVRLTGFGTFELRKRQARVSLHPKTRERIQIPSSRTPSFSAGSQLKEAMEGNPLEGDPPTPDTP